MKYIVDKTYNLYFESLNVSHNGVLDYNLTPIKENAKEFKHTRDAWRYVESNFLHPSHWMVVSASLSS